MKSVCRVEFSHGCRLLAQKSFRDPGCCWEGKEDSLISGLPRGRQSRSWLGSRAWECWAPGLRSMGQGTGGAASRAPGGLGWGCPHWSFVFQGLFFLSRILPSPAFLFACLPLSFSISFVKGVKKGTDNLQLFSDSCFLLGVLMCLDVFVSLFNFHVSPVYPKKVTCSF